MENGEIAQQTTKEDITSEIISNVLKNASDRKVEDSSDSKEDFATRRAKNAAKKARRFEIEEMFKTTRENAPTLACNSKDSRKSLEKTSDQNRSEDNKKESDPQSGRPTFRETNEWAESIKISQSGEDVVLMDPRSDVLDVSEDDSAFEVPLPENFVVSHKETTNDHDESEDDYDDFSGIPIVELIPAAAEASLSHGKKPVSTIAFDNQGTKFATGGLDYVVNLFEFQKMDLSLRSSRELMPCENYVINSLAFSANGEYLLVCSGKAQIHILDRQGKQWAETVRGDQYLVDLSNTKGHTASVNACCWHPIIKNEFLSCSDDGTLRIWSIDDFKEITRCINKQRKIIKTKNIIGKRAIPTTCTYSRDGKFVAAGCDDGSIQIWKHGNLYVNTYRLNRKAHAKAVTSLQFSPNSKQILSRSLDGTLKLWDLSSFNDPLHTVEDLPNEYSNTDCGFSPHGELVYAGVSLGDDIDEHKGALAFFDASTFELVYNIKFEKVSCIRVIWQPKLNQVLVSLSDGSLRIFYDPQQSFRGIMQCVSRPLRRARQQEIIREELIISPLTLEMFQPRGEEGEEKELTSWRLKKYLRMQDNKLRPEFRKPADMPMSGPSAGGRMAASGGTLHSYIAKQVGTKRNRDFLADTDVRASILRHAKEAEKNPYYVTKAYLRNQPVTLFQEKTTAPEEEETDKELEPLYKVPKTK